MTDFMTPEQRHNNMSRIKGSNTEPEIYIRTLLFSNGYRYRIQPKHLAGRPDIWMPKYNTAIFVNGCFWHRHLNCRYAYMPKSRIEFWENKFAHNIERDNAVREKLLASEKRCLIIWECTIRKMKTNKDLADDVFKQIEAFLKSNIDYLEL